MEHFAMKVDDRSRKIGGQQCVTTPEGYKIPLDISNGLPHLTRVCPGMLGTLSTVPNSPALYLAFLRELARFSCNDSEKLARLPLFFQQL